MAGSGDKPGKGAAAAGVGGAGRAPRGTRDFYPQDMLKRRYIESMWRHVAIRHGFEEIDGPRFEHLDLYTIKSGEGIVSELFSFKREGGEDVYALRPEFTPTLARMVAARANALPKPVKWFSVGPYFRAERPQRGRLREFLQWNVDIVGDDSWQADAEVIKCCADFLRACGLTPEDVRIKVSERSSVVRRLRQYGVSEEKIEPALALLDARPKLAHDAYAERALELGLSGDGVEFFHPANKCVVRFDGKKDPKHHPEGGDELLRTELDKPGTLLNALKQWDLLEWGEFDSMVIRGLAYYTGTVFEVHESSGKERAIAGGGRYDNLVELFGGPATPAVGFAMGDVVLANVLEDRKPMPSVEKLRDRFGYAPDAFVIPGEGDEAAARVVRVVAQLRASGVHVRKSYRATRNVGKLLGEADKAGAHFALIAHENGSLERKRLRDEDASRDARRRLEKAAQGQGWTIEEA